MPGVPEVPNPTDASINPSTPYAVDILLTTLNARYSHSALGLRYLFANLGELQSRTALLEFTINQRAADIVEALLAYQPRLIGLGVYIWNCREIRAVVSLLKQVRPDICLVLGGPEVSYEWDAQPWLTDADYVIGGAADFAFAELCQQVLAGKPPATKFIPAASVDVKQLTLPYAFYSDTDIAQRVLYVEASRGCPFKCEFCLSALDKTAYPFDLDAFLAAMDTLWQRGARQFKFVDRTFNLKPAHSARILEFFQQRLDAQTFLHFELIPDYLPTTLQALLTQFPPASLQFEIGIQSFNPDVQQRISRKQDNAKAAANLAFLRAHAHLHTDLIVGLPGEDLASFASGFNRLVALQPHEIQVGILKRLRGAPISRHSEAFAMRYESEAPYTVLQTADLDFLSLQRLGRFARYWDLIANSGRFPNSLPLLLGDQAFQRFMQVCDWWYARFGQTHKIALERLFEWVYQGLTEALAVSEADAQKALQADFLLTQIKKYPDFLPPLPRPQSQGNSSLPKRQARHAQGLTT